MNRFMIPADGAYIARLRIDYPVQCQGRTDAEVMAYYNPRGFKYVECTLWDDLRDAASDYEALAASLADALALIDRIVQEDYLDRMQDDAAIAFLAKMEKL